MIGSTPTPRRVYMDNAATSFPKPRSVWDAMQRYALECGASAGRGAYAEAMESATVLSECRRKLNRLFNGENPDHFIFTLNCTDGLNLGIHGLLGRSENAHAICTAIDHNSILRPLHDLAEQKTIERTIVPVDTKTGLVDPDDIRSAIQKNTRLIAITHASNVTGTVQSIRPISAIAREHGIPLLVDAAQSAGHLPIDVQADMIDLLAAPGHKGLLGPLGTGFLYIRPGLEKILHPIRQGGTGSVSEEGRQPDFMPDRYEAGSHNAIGIAGLDAGLDWILDRTVEKIAAHERELVGTFLDGIDGVPELKLLGPPGVKNRLGVFSMRVDAYEPLELAAILETSYGILTRAGLHCAPHIHKTIGTLDTGGTTRLSFSPFLSSQDVQFAADALCEIALQAPAHA
ncbi:MAG TPA: aminotransferase class V-fold PLP-dependent enzyme [Tepidisphaeraceae bacterium]|nr:aminotransferase class V-fold PLP-dependent enzyme [Tepidisphaeraceae bacterium]